MPEPTAAHRLDLGGHASRVLFSDFVTAKAEKRETEILREVAMEIKGGCLCGAVRYSATAEPAFSAVCYCRDCQRFTGSAFGTLVGIPKAALKVDGTPKTFSGLGGSGKPILRHFCPECGSSIAEEPATRPGLIILNVGTLDDPAPVTPTREIFCDDALSWVHLGGDMQRFSKSPH